MMTKNQSGKLLDRAVRSMVREHQITRSTARKLIAAAKIGNYIDYSLDNSGGVKYYKHMLIYHNVEQNKAVKGADDVVAAILAEGFRDGFQSAVWFSDKPIVCEFNGFTGLAVAVPSGVDITQFEQADDSLMEQGFTTYAIPASVVNGWPREQVWV